MERNAADLLLFNPFKVYYYLCRLIMGVVEKDHGLTRDHSHAHPELMRLLLGGTKGKAPAALDITMAPPPTPL